MLNHGYTYAETLAVSQRANFRIEDIIGGDKKLDFSRPFMPESLAGTAPLTFLTEHERRVLNQIRGHAYLCLFGVVEEFILPFVVDHVRPRLNQDDDEVRALLQFAGEEAKHIQLFRLFQEEFREGFGTRCDIIGPASEVGRAVLAHHPLAVALTILHIEWMTQAHYIESVRDDQALDPQFKSLLKNHWMEEAQHAKLDTLIVESLAARCDARERAQAVEEYLEIGAFLDEGLGQQVQFDLDAFERATGRKLTDAEREQATQVQRRANRYTYLGSGMIHPKFRAQLAALGPDLAERVASVAPAFC